jgi:hypothetical protein
VPALLDGHLEKVHLCFFAGTMNEWNEHLGPLAPPFAQVVSHGGDADLVALLDELFVDPSPGEALL